MKLAIPAAQLTQLRHHEMKRLLRIFELSKNEQRVVLIVILLLTIIAFVAYERRVHHFPVESVSSTQPKPSSTPVKTLGDE